MEFIVTLWLPLLISTVVVFAMGSVMNMVLPHHQKDYTRLPNEDAFREEILNQELTPAQYSIPYVHSAESWNDPKAMEKYKTGPVGLLILAKPREGMLRQLIGQATYVLCISVMVAYIAEAVFGSGEASALAVLQLTGVSATLGYSGALFINSIWFGVPWGNTLRHALDGLVYGVLTGVIFMWLWPGS